MPLQDSCCISFTNTRLFAHHPLTCHLSLSESKESQVRINPSKQNLGQIRNLDINPGLIGPCERGFAEDDILHHIQIHVL